MSSNIFNSSQNNIQQIISSNENENGSSHMSMIKKYWCHICKKEFSNNIINENIDIQCNYCGKTFCEILETHDTSNQSHPINFNPFILNNNNNTENNINNINNNNINNNNNSSINVNVNRNRRNIFVITNTNRRRGRRRNRILDLIANYLIIEEHNDNIDDIINHIMLNDPNKYGNPPAAKKAIEKLKKYKINEEKIKEFGFENSCAVCKDEFNIGEECLSMPCNHYFHENCLLPWLKERNSCPICRYELPTDDADFEEMKKQKLNNSNSNVNRQNIQGS